MKYLKVSLVIVVLICVIGLVGCAMFGKSKLQGDLVGAWVSPCYKGEAAWYGKSTVTYTNAEVTLLIETYSDSDCTTPLWKGNYSAEYSVGNEIVNSLEQTVTEIDYIATTTLLTISNIASVNGFNDNKVCGYTDWEFNVPKDITGNPNCNPPVASAGDVFKAVIQLSDDSTTFKGSALTQPNGDRITELNEIVFAKQ